MKDDEELDRRVDTVGKTKLSINLGDFIIVSLQIIEPFR
jgi:hypothetical protein